MQSSDGVLIGSKGVKYGLHKPAGPKQQQAPAAKKSVTPKNVFGDDSDEDDVEVQINRQAEKKRSAAKVQQIYEAALAEDPTAFDYDGVYDSIQAARNVPKQQDKIQRQSKYITQLKEQADQRKREQDVYYERRLLKERAAEDALFEDKEKFVTSAYRRKLEEDKKWAEEQKRKDEEDEKNDVRKVGHLGNFYSNLLTKNVAMGAKTGKDTSTADKSKDSQHADRIVGSERGSDHPGPGPVSREGSQEPTTALVVPAGKQPVLDKYDLLRLEAEKARKTAMKSAAGEGGGDTLDGAPDMSQGQEQQQKQSGVEDTQHHAQSTAQGLGVSEGKEAVQGAPDEKAGAGPPVAATAAGKRRNDDTSVMSARERYLARKKQATGA